MSRHDSQPPHPDWQPEQRPCPCFERPETVTARLMQQQAARGFQVDHSIPPNIELGGRGD